MKVDGKVGTVSAGKYADIIAVRGDVLRDISLLQRVDRRGQARRPVQVASNGSGADDHRIVIRDRRPRRGSSEIPRRARGT
jgi:hypothetical protein